MPRVPRSWIVLVLALSPAVALADEPPPRAAVAHVPPGQAPSDRPLVLRMDLVHPDQIDHVDVHWRAGGRGAYRIARVRRGANGPSPDGAWAAVIRRPRAGVDQIQYWITLTERGGATREVFAQAARPHVVVVQPTPDDAQETADLAHRSGQRLDLVAGGEWVDFGGRDNEAGALCGPDAGATCSDQWYTLFAAVRYHFLRRVRSVGVRVERLRGTTTRAVEEKRVGLVAATADVEIRLGESVSLSLLGILGANEEAVQPGGGASLSFGAGEPTQLDVGLRGIADVGWTLDAWMRWRTIRHTPLGAGLEITTLPGNDDDAAVRLLAEVGRELGRHVTVTLRGGYGARDLSAGGVSLGGQVQVAF